MLDKPQSAAGDYSRGIWSKLAMLQNAGDPLTLLLQIARNRRGCIPLQMGSQRVFLLTAAEQFKQVLATNSANYGKYLEGMTPIFGRSMITMDGALWQKMRAIQQPAFHPDALAEYVPHLLSAIDARVARWRGLEDGAVLDIGPEMWGLAVDMICKALFDRETPFNPDFVYNAVEAFTTVTNHGSVGKFGEAPPRAQNDGKDATDDAIAYATNVWDSLPELVLSAPPFQNRERTFLRMVEAAAADPAIGEFDRAQVIDEIKQYIWAGTETTALVLTWALYLLAKHPDVADQIRHEVDAICGAHTPTLADFERLTFTRSVVSETMRMYPPIWSLARIAEGPDAIDGQQIQAGDIVMLWVYVAHHDPRYWDDPLSFEPKRFGERTKAPAPYTYLPFGGGKRACIGSTMSQIEMVLALSRLLREFNLHTVGDPPGVKLSVVLSPNSRVPLRVERRKGLGAPRPDGA
ncbi:MAG TPA: cytochrome P450 [Xanthobacteraceae bacterium]|nr:cytochrome P450 [Xanthobacteraceae bacterium]